MEELFQIHSDQGLMTIKPAWARIVTADLNGVISELGERSDPGGCVVIIKHSSHSADSHPDILKSGRGSVE